MNRIYYLFLLLLFFVQQKGVAQKQVSFEVQSNNNSQLLYAVCKEEYLQYGVDIAYLNQQGDTIIPFGKYKFLGSDTLRYYADVMHFENGKWRWVAIDQQQRILFDLFSFDNGPDDFNNGLRRIKRNGLFGFANKKGQIVIPCQYTFAYYFNEGIAKVTKSPVKFIKSGEYTSVKSKNWIYINTKGEKVE
jgi:hypothetical protein